MCMHHFIRYIHSPKLGIKGCLSECYACWPGAWKRVAALKHCAVVKLHRLRALRLTKRNTFMCRSADAWPRTAMRWDVGYNFFVQHPNFPLSLSRPEQLPCYCMFRRRDFHCTKRRHQSIYKAEQCNLECKHHKASTHSLSHTHKHTHIHTPLMCT